MSRAAFALTGALCAAALLSAGCAASSSAPGAATTPVTLSAGSTSAGSTGAGSTGAGSTGAGSTGAGSTTTGASSSTNTAAACSPATLQTKKADTFTVATDSPAYSPWFADDKPTNGMGFESAVAYAVAEQLGYSGSQVAWTVEPFDSATGPTPKKFDVDINEFSITAARAKAVDFSSPYYDVTQAVIALKGDRYANATTIADLKGAKLGAQKGTTSFDAITAQLRPTQTPAEYPTNSLAVQALKNGTIDGLVVDLPTGLYITAAQIDNSTIVGQLPALGSPERFGMLLEKASPITACVSQAVDALRADGTLAALQKRWLTTSAGAPVLK